jgi:SPP1 gp7 family putative phage head morphogenesis protein
LITHSRLAEVRKKLFGRKLAKRPKPPNEAERLYLGAMRGWAAEFKTIVMGAIAETYPKLAELAAKHDGFDPDEPRDEQGRWTGSSSSDFLNAPDPWAGSNDLFGVFQPEVKSSIYESTKESEALDVDQGTLEHEALREQALARINAKVTPAEKDAAYQYLHNYHTIVKAEAEGKDTEHSKVVREMVERESKGAQPITLFRGMQLKSEDALKLKVGENFALQSTSSFSTSAATAAHYAAGTLVKKEGTVPVLLKGNLRGMPLPGGHGFERDVLVPRSAKLQITRIEHIQHPRHGLVTLVHVEEGARKDAFDPDEPRDENGRWTGGGDVSRAGVSASGKPLKPRAYEWTTPAGVTHRFTDKPGERDTYEFKSADQLTREGEAKERMYAAISEHATEHPGFDYQGAHFKKDKENPGRFRITHEHNELGINATRDIFEPGGSYQRADGARLDALASKVLQGITTPLREAADRVPLSQVGGTVRSHVEHDVPRYMPGLANTDLFLGSEIAAWRNENVDLITNLSDEMRDRIGDLLEDYDGTRVEEMATALEDTFGVTRARAELIARDQTLKLNGRMNQAAQTAAGVDRYRWSTSNDGSVRNDPKDRGYPNHEILNNTVHRWDDPPVTCERTGATNHPGQDFQCRCIAIPVLEEFDDATDDLPTQEFDGGDFDESKHPRDEKGQFTEGAGLGERMSANGINYTSHDKFQAAAQGIFGHHLDAEHIQGLLNVHKLDIPGAHTVEYLARPTTSDSIHLEAKVKDQAGNVLLHLKRQFNTSWESGHKEIEVNHDVMMLHESIQGKGLGSKLFDEQLRAYQQTGVVSRITTDAAWTGQYQWPRLGFSLRDPSKFEGYKQEMTRFMQEKGLKVDLSKAKTMHDLSRVQTSTPFAHREGQTTKLGKAWLESRPVGNEIGLKFELGPKSKELKAYEKTGKH